MSATPRAGALAGLRGNRLIVTGGIGSGKSTVSGLLARRGAVVVDADRVSRELMAPDSPVVEELRNAFGPRVVNTLGQVDRAELALIVFNDRTELEKLNGIMHPKIARRSAELLDSIPPNTVAVYEMPLVVEQGGAAMRDWGAIVVVDAPEDVRLERLERKGMSLEDARARMGNQASREERLAVADVVIDNSGDMVALERQVESLWQSFRLGDGSCSP